jgi:hypothetical protein
MVPSDYGRSTRDGPSRRKNKKPPSHKRNAMKPVDVSSFPVATIAVVLGMIASLAGAESAPGGVQRLYIMNWAPDLYE